MLAVKQFLTFVNGAPFQPAIAVGLGCPTHSSTGWPPASQRKRDLLPRASPGRFEVRSPAGGYFVVADAAPLGHPDAGALCRDCQSWLASWACP